MARISRHLDQQGLDLAGLRHHDKGPR
jgi:hypothetical protein